VPSEGSDGTLSGTRVANSNSLAILQRQQQQQQHHHHTTQLIGGGVREEYSSSGGSPAGERHARRLHGGITASTAGSLEVLVGL
jgi:hypothetical protein